MSRCETLKVVQIGGLAGNIAVPLVELRRDDLDDAGREAMDQACVQLSAAAASAGEAPAIGADLGSYRVEISGGNDTGVRRFTLPMSAGSEESPGAVDVPAVLQHLLQAAGVTS